MIGTSATIRHAVVGTAIAGTTLLAGFGVLVDPDAGHPERFDARTVVVAHDGADGLRITHYVDIDFGDADRRGYLLEVDNDFGVPTDVVAASPDAADDLTVTPYADTTEIRIGDPDRTWSGQHRYELSYTLPDARFDELADAPFLFVDIVRPEDASGADPETGRFEVIVTGFELGTTRCDTGGFGDEGGCELVDAGDGTYRAVLEPLPEGAGLSVGGSIEAFTDPVEIDPPPVPDRRGEPDRALVALGFLALGLAGAVPVYLWARHRGRNEVFAGGAADAAYGTLPPPGSAVTAAPAVTWVPDEQMDELATTEFVPPDGIEPWEGSVLLRERVDDETVQAWLSGLVGREALDIEQVGDDLRLSSGPRRSELGPPDAELLGRILRIDDPYTTGKYDARFAKAWSAIRASQADRIARSGWWKRPPHGVGAGAMSAGSASSVVVIAAFMVLFWLGSGSIALLGALRAWPFSVLIGIAVPALVAFLAYRALLPARSASGSALALRAESFRRFLHASEARHVEWAWSHGLLREYSAWAVALGEADAWSEALARANVPEPARVAAVPIAVHTAGRSLSGSRTAPSSSGGGGGGGGFSGGGVGGGGGGGRSGSW